jgi:hypothetical protein
MKQSKRKKRKENKQKKTVLPVVKNLKINKNFRMEMNKNLKKIKL